MKTIKIASVVLFTFFILTSCTSKMNFVTSSTVPAATGTIRVKQDKNKNYVLTVNVQNLAESQSLTPPKNTYLVWMESNENSIKRLGQLSPSGKSLKATLSATAIAKPTQVYITAENNMDIQYPDGQVILTTRN